MSKQNNTISVLNHIRGKKYIISPDGDGQIEIKAWNLEQVVEMAETIGNIVEQVASIVKEVIEKKNILSDIFSISDEEILLIKDKSSEEIRNTIEAKRMDSILGLFDLAPIIIQLLRKIPEDIKNILIKSTGDPEIGKRLDLASTVECLEAIISLNFMNQPMLLPAIKKFGSSLGMKLNLTKKQ